MVAGVSRRDGQTADVESSQTTVAGGPGGSTIARAVNAVVPATGQEGVVVAIVGRACQGLQVDAVNATAAGVPRIAAIGGYVYAPTLRARKERVIAAIGW